MKRKTKWEKAKAWKEDNVTIVIDADGGTEYGHYFLFEFAWIAGYHAGMRNRKKLAKELRE